MSKIGKQQAEAAIKRQAVLDFLKANPAAERSAIVEATGIRKDSIGSVLRQMLAFGEIEKLPAKGKKHTAAQYAALAEICHPTMRQPPTGRVAQRNKIEKTRLPYGGLPYENLWAN